MLFRSIIGRNGSFEVVRCRHPVWMLEVLKGRQRPQVSNRCKKEASVACFTLFYSQTVLSQKSLFFHMKGYPKCLTSYFNEITLK